MFPYKNKIDPKFFNGYGVKLAGNGDSRNSYLNATLQLLLNIDRSFTYELFLQIFYYEGKDEPLLALKKVLDEIRDLLEGNRDRMDNLMDSDCSLGKTPPKKKDTVTSPNPAEDPIDTKELVRC